ncbi:MAG: glycine--tRNA ligase [Methanobacteriota archaeon]|nr:MAG: glycine--tRNA ligase [Euryarchaeota archaeon]
MEVHERVFEIALNRLFFYPSNEIYEARAGFYDYGPVGIRIKRNIERLWREVFIEEEDAYEVSSAVVTPEIVLQASGHVDEFTDPLLECAHCHYKVRADKIVEELEGKAWNGDMEELREKLKGFKCRRCGKEAGSNIYKSNLMFSTAIGYDGDKAYLRPETAQGIFTSFDRNFKSLGATLPIAIGQVGRSFRNEISPRRGLIRLREFHQMELEYFMDPQKQEHKNFEKLKDVKMAFMHRGANEVVEETPSTLVEKEVCSGVFAYFLAKEWLFMKRVGLDVKRMWFRHLEEGETPHYSGGNIDLEVETSYGIVEVAGNAYRKDYDLSRHAQFSKKNLSVKEEDGREFIPHVFEVSIGLERTLFSMLEHTFVEKGERKWAWFRFTHEIAPYMVALYPLLSNNEEIVKMAKKVREELKGKLPLYYREKGSIGRRYAKADEIGIPYAITVDHESLEDGTVTIRDRDSGEQVRVAVEDIVERIMKSGVAGEVIDGRKG